MTARVAAWKHRPSGKKLEQGYSAGAYNAHAASQNTQGERTDIHGKLIEGTQRLTQGKRSNCEPVEKAGGSNKGGREFAWWSRAQCHSHPPETFCCGSQENCASAESTLGEVESEATQKRRLVHAADYPKPSATGVNP